MVPYYPFQSEKAKEAYTKYYRTQEEETWPVPFEDITVETSFGSTFVRVSGPKEAPPLILLAGITATSLMWYPNVALWAKTYRVYAIDTINDYGLSVNTKTIWRKKQFVQWMHEVFTELVGGNKFNLVGMSYGGWLAALYALAHQERLIKYVMIAPGATVVPISWRFFASLAAIFLLPGIIVQPVLLSWATQSVDQENIQSNDLSNFITAFLRGYSKFKHRWVVPLSVLTPEEWKSIKVPAMFMVGSEEKLYDAKEAIDHLAKVAPDIRSVLVPDCGHDLTFVRNEIINSEVKNFLDGTMV